MSTPVPPDIAVVGLACRVPGAEGPQELWRLMTEGRRAGSPAPKGRFALDAVPREVRERLGQGHYFADVERFEAGLFGVTEREAAAIDPHQRATLELCWTALEDAGRNPAAPAEGETGVFVGSMGADWAMEHAAGRRGRIGPGTLAATETSVLAARVSHALGLRGPSLVLDTGQSSSLVAVHHALLALRAGDCSSALVAGVNLNLSTEAAVATASFGGQSPSGRATLFEDDADGYVRGEGGAAVVLRPLADALRSGDRVYAVLRGSAVTHDGEGPALLVPEPAGHVRAMLRAQSRAAVAPRDIGYVELHGTGTRVGDAAEAEVLTRVFGERPDPGRAAPLRVGSIKTTIGHLEGAAGLLGLVKAVLAVRAGAVPGTSGHRGGESARRLSRAGIEVPADLVGLPPGTLVGVSSIGMGGTNCHVVLGPPPAPSTAPDTPTRRDERTRTGADAAEPVPVLLSAATEDAVRRAADALDAWAAEHADRLAEPGELATMARTLTGRRARLAHRAGFTARSVSELRERLGRLASHGRARSVHRGRGDRARTAFLYPGQGSQHPGMGAELHARLPGFARRFDDIAAVADPMLDTPLRDLVLTTDAQDPDVLRSTRNAQLALFAFSVALSGCVEDLGVRADVLLGHSVGELAAAHVAGVFSLTDAVRLVIARGNAMAKADPTGVMVSVRAPLAETRAVVAAHTPGVDIAAVNGRSTTVLSGDRAAVLACAGALRERGFRVRELAVAHAFHSHHMDPVLEEFRAAAERIDYHAPDRPVLSNLTGALATGRDLRTADYWVDHVRRTVRFADGLGVLREQGTGLCLELGVGRTLTGLTLDDAGPGDDVAAESFVRDPRAEYAGLLDALVLAGVRGHEVRYDALPRLAGDGWTPLPTYPFGAAKDAGASQAPADTTAAVDAPAATTPAVAPPRDPLALVLGAVREVLSLPADRPVPPDQALADLGMTSLPGLELRAELVALTGLDLPSSLLYEHPSPRALADRLTDLGLRASGSAGVGTPEPAASAPPAAVAEDPVVVMATACRYPGGVNDPEALWRLALSGQHALGELPSDRGPAWAAEGEHARMGGFLKDVANFDAAFFGISPREARAMDPQQRIVLELCWEAVERAGVDPGSLRGRDVGVFLGAMAGDYAAAAREGGDALGGHELTGASNAVLSGRVSYQLGLEGPAMTVDTACSSSLVALHLAARSLLAGECEIALAGGVTVMSTPRMFEDFQRLGGLSAEGRCRPFSADADGTVWSEGAGLVVLARLSEARRRGCPVLAVIRGSAVNQDGASNGLTAPSGAAQRRVIRRALADAGLRAGDVDVVEAHGTGTVLGDAVEARGVIETYGDRAPADGQVVLGSLKAVTGHTQAAAGVGGLIKAVLAMRYGLAPGTLSGADPTPKVDWPSSVLLPRGPVPWPKGSRTRRMAVSSFGMSGTNAHVIVEEPPATASGARTESTTHPDHPGALPFVVSAGSDSALRDQLERLREALTPGRPGPEGTDAAAPAGGDDDAGTPLPELTAVAGTLALRRAQLPHRAAVVAADRGELLAGLTAARRGDSGDDVALGRVRGEPAVAFVFPGQGSQWTGMAGRLLRESPVFARAAARCEAAFAPHLDFSVLRLLAGDDAEGRADTLVGVQVSLFTVMVGLAELWRDCGVTPDVVIGHSQGEVAAAHIAGALTLEDAATVVSARAGVLARLSGSGTMAVIGLDEPDVRALLAERAEWAPDAAVGGVAVAAVNGPGSTVVSGPTGAVRALLHRCATAGVRTRRIAVDYASHSAMVEPVRAELLDALAGITPRAARTPFFSTARAEWLTGTGLDASYWYENLRGEVRFADSVTAVAGYRPTAFVEVSPHPVLTTSVTAVLDGLDGAGASAAVGSLRRERGGLRDFLASLTLAWAQGVPVAWNADALGVAGAGPADLPPTPFDGRRFWLRTGAVGTESARGADRPAPEPERTSHAGPAAPEPVDAVVLRKVADVLGLGAGDARRTADSSFRELGLDSLTTIDLRRRIRDTLGVDVPVAAFQTHDTPERLARWVRDHHPNSGEEPSHE
ncbi:hypothetical protein GCM10023347_04840 [Streptomyces chumphonensis]|uniref:Acyltransferase domain-containing protein n=1 Tax=Streptomyces chumphonensis TaxID=1214925 RepID=A0A927F0S9_9ACTN|nr:type I polyketide synthase [Streptomyces chumphonensis]MBD3933116.1 acyltransferase domain-containing protein [Streptomyces chumphonensis]